MTRGRQGLITLLFVVHMYLTETVTTCLTTWHHAAVNDGSKSSLPASNADREVAHAWSVAPNMVKGRHGKITSPPQSDTEAAEGCHELVAAIFAAFKAFIAVPPKTVYGVCSLRFAKDVFKLNLELDS